LSRYIKTFKKEGASMKIVVAPDSFKGSLSSVRAADAIEKGIQGAAQYYNKPVEVIKVPMADGGEGTVEAIMTVNKGEIINTRVLDPLGREIDSFFGILPDNTAVIEMAAASGINLLSEQERNPMKTTSYGTGQLIKKALDCGCKRIIVGIGGSATNDGGVGMAQALGVSFLDKEGNQIGFGGGELSKIDRIDVTSLDSRIKDTVIIVASDVKNPLCGPNGASSVYGPQKGATHEMVKVLDRNLKHLAEVIRKQLEVDVLDVPGSGAAGGLGAGLIAFLGARFYLGIKLVMELVQFEEKIKMADLVITGEGSTDYQTLFGKVPFGIAKIAKQYNKPVLCISGSLGKGYEQLYSEGIDAFFSIVNRPMSLEEAMNNAATLLEQVSKNAIKTFLLNSYRHKS